MEGASLLQSMVMWPKDMNHLKSNFKVILIEDLIEEDSSAYIMEINVLLISMAVNPINMMLNHSI